MHQSPKQSPLGNAIHRNLIASLLLTALSCAPLICRGADNEPATGDEQVVITGTRSPSLMSYRVMLAGLDEFEEDHSLAPNAREVLFRLKSHQTGADALDGLALKIAGDSVTIPVPLTPDGEFTLPRSTVADDEDADMMLNKDKRVYSLDVEVFSEGLPANMRRLGDLRLECEVAVAIAKKEIGFFWKATINTILLTSDWCMSGKVDIPSYVKRPIESATLINGNERIALKIEKDHHGFAAPINVKQYSNDTLIELQYGTETAAQ